jgi:3,4-dihydroxy 2-butanone 4-phosphate synthase/GTP cyclohydrolase II
VPPLVRVHLRDTPRDLIGSAASTRLDAARGAQSGIAREHHGIVVVLRPEETAADIVGMGAHEAAPEAGEGGAVLRTYGIGAQILRDLGVTRMRVLSAPRQLLGISAFGPRGHRLRGVSARSPDILAA